MSTPTIPYSYRERKGREIAAKPEQVFEIQRRQRYLVMSQSYTSDAYEVTATGTGWTCTCPDYRRRAFDCKHIFTIKAIQEAEAELARWEAQPRFDPQTTVDRIEELMGRPHIGEEELETLHILRNTATMPTVEFALQYFWTGFRPEELLDEIDSFGLKPPETISVKTPKSWSWRPINGTIDTVRDVIINRNLKIGLAQVEPYTRTLGRLGDATYNVFLVS